MPSELFMNRLALSAAQLEQAKLELTYTELRAPADGIIGANTRKAIRALQLARQLQYLLEGALSMAHIEGPGEQARDAKVAAERLLEAAGI